MTPRIRANGPTEVDIAVVGAGPAGAAAACHCARAGFRVVLIDQRRFPRDKVCGDFVGPTSLRELDRLGVSAHPALRDANEIRTGALNINGATVVERPLPHFTGLRDYGLCVPRVVLDDAIVQAAVESGARFIEDARVTGYETGARGVTLFHQRRGAQQCLRTKLLIGADGSSSLISRILRGAKPPRRDRIVAVRAYFDGVEGPSDRADLYVNGLTFPGYCWLFPTGTNSANVGVAMLLEACTPARQPLSELLVRLIESDPAFRVRLAQAKMCGRVVGWPLTTYNPQLPIVANRVALIGDAAGLGNPLSGEGIQYALRSARWILEALHGPLSSDSLSAGELRSYAARVQAEMRYDMALSRLIVNVATNRALDPLWLSALKVIGKKAESDSGYCDLVAGFFMGLVPAHELLTLRSAVGRVSAAARTGCAAAVNAYQGARRSPTNSAALIDVFMSLCKDSVRHPIATLAWGMDCASEALELATRMAMSLGRHAS